MGPMNIYQRSTFASRWAEFAISRRDIITEEQQLLFFNSILAGEQDDQIRRALLLQHARREQYALPHPKPGFIYVTPFGQFTVPGDISTGMKVMGTGRPASSSATLDSRLSSTTAFGLNRSALSSTGSTQPPNTSALPAPCSPRQAGSKFGILPVAPSTLEPPATPLKPPTHADPQLHASEFERIYGGAAQMGQNQGPPATQDLGNSNPMDFDFDDPFEFMGQPLSSSAPQVSSSPAAMGLALGQTLSGSGQTGQISLALSQTLGSPTSMPLGLGQSSSTSAQMGQQQLGYPVQSGSLGGMRMGSGQLSPFSTQMGIDSDIFASSPEGQL